MSNRETSPEIATMAGRILAGGNPLDNEQVMNAIWLALPPKPSQQALTAALLVLKPYFENMLSLAASCLSQAEPDDSDSPPSVMISATVGWDKITNAIIGAFEGGSNYWLREAEYEYVPEPKPSERPWYVEESFWSQGGKMKLHYDNPEDGEDRASQIVGLLEIKKGLRVMAEKAPRHFADMLSEDDDATTHDVFIQCVLFGEIVYG